MVVPAEGQVTRRDGLGEPERRLKPAHLIVLVFPQISDRMICSSGLTTEER